MAGERQSAAIGGRASSGRAGVDAGVAARAGLGYRPDLDGLRALSCLLVFCFHIQRSKLWLGQLGWMNWLQGWVGVYVFFALSGFLITSLLVAEEARTGRVRFGAFLLRREFRIVPAYYATVGLYGLLCWLPAGRANWTEFRAGFWYWVLYAGDWATHVPAVGTLLGHSWSLAVEQRYYLVWPLMFLATRRWRWRVALGLAAAAPLSLLKLEDFFPYLALLLGSAVALLRAHGLGTGWVRRAPAWAWGAAAVAGFELTSWDWRWLGLFAAAVAGLLWRLGEDESWLKRALGCGALRWLGKISYSFYLLHVVAINVAMRVVRPEGLLRACAATAVALGLAVGLAWGSYLGIEEPLRRLGRRVAG